MDGASFVHRATIPHFLPPRFALFLGLVSSSSTSSSSSNGRLTAFCFTWASRLRASSASPSSSSWSSYTSAFGFLRNGFLAPAVVAGFPRSSLSSASLASSAFLSPAGSSSDANGSFFAAFFVGKVPGGS
ncbi:hypothetical protein PHLGIDRAFT_139218 [Phlebiopsis gigantea 11061_1 CR5-6]|uniref:Uncharacterized protein n=1 Tax=Phlebiopsis gigantea (strain 11061_1 CR5-6) TaxID=745531 RepID=A0A0C3SCU7_PHLG1|nr:hypothetical protein PHLGIDRAFT_139218 [Phlebiopsis gigantea 11061_1 CR5-6]